MLESGPGTVIVWVSKRILSLLLPDRALNADLKHCFSYAGQEAQEAWLYLVFTVPEMQHIYHLKFKY